jgi:hypothetical protein
LQLEKQWKPNDIFFKKKAGETTKKHWKHNMKMDRTKGRGTKRPRVTRG